MVNIILIIIGACGVLLFIHEILKRRELLSENRIKFFISVICFVIFSSIFNVFLNNPQNPIFVLIISCLIGFGISLICQLYLFKYIVKLVDKNKHDVQLLYDIVGKTGLAEVQITKSFGVVVLNNKKILCRTLGDVIPEGQRVLVTDYCTDDELFIVDYYP